MRATWLAVGLIAGAAIGLMLPLAAQQPIDDTFTTWGIRPGQMKIIVCLDALGQFRRNPPLTLEPYQDYGARLTCPP